MKSKTLLWAIQLVCAAALVAAASCGPKSKINLMAVQNIPPVVRITAAPIDTNQVCHPTQVMSCYSITVHWLGYDADGRVDHYLYAIDPPTQANSDTVWQTSRSNEERLLFRSTTQVPDSDPLAPLARDYHVFVIKAVDNTGVAGPPVNRAFFSYTEAPSVVITNPHPDHLAAPTLTSSVRFNWTGTDNDGVFNSKPVKYKFFLFNPSSATPEGLSLHPDTLAVDPDRIRRVFAPNFVGWDSTAGDTTTVQYTNLPPNQRYMFVVVAFDEAGAYSPVFNLDTNMLRFQVKISTTQGPQITIFNEFFNYSWKGGYCPCVQTTFFIEVPADRPVVFNWTATPQPGADVRYYRWALDITDVTDETQRTSETDTTQFKYWSTPALQVTSAFVGTFHGTILPDPPEEHLFYLEAVDNVGLKSLAIIRFQVVRASFAKPLLVVKDTRMQVDLGLRNSNPPCVQQPGSSGFWPIQSEADTFLFARGGYPWRCWPAGTITRPGIFSRYGTLGVDYDTLGTRTGKKSLTFPLSKLSQYSHVVWITDYTDNSDLGDQRSPAPSLRYMSDKGRFNTLAAYIKQGGRVWVLGAGAAFATNTNPWDLSGNGLNVYSGLGPESQRDLRPGRFMFDVAHWQSEIAIGAKPAAIRRLLGRYDFVSNRNAPAVGSEYMRYATELPAQMRARSAPEDTLPPSRRFGSQYYINVFKLEYMDEENFIIENVSTNPDVVDEQSTLDTLYEATGGGLRLDRHNVVMTHYHGPGLPQGFTFTGFAVWDFKRADCQAMVDFVLQRMWGLTPHATFRGRIAANEAWRPAGGTAPRPAFLDRLRGIRKPWRVPNAPPGPSGRD